MKTWAELGTDRATVNAIIELDDALVPGETIFTSEHVALYPMVDVTSVSPQPAQGWTYDGKTFTAPAAPAPVPVDLKAYAASARYAKETAGITVNGAPIATDRDSQALITGAYSYVLAKPDATINFKSASGFVTLTADQIQAIALAVGAHVQACFAAEAQIDADIQSGKVTTTAQVDAAIAAVGV